MIPHDSFILLACIDKPPKRQLWVAFFYPNGYSKRYSKALFDVIQVLYEVFNFLAVWACVLAARANIINRIS
ncbi:MAG TPA: hypothetical protein VGM52_11850 [Herbaspirillum sp.]|jgi:hypothetical protein